MRVASVVFHKNSRLGRFLQYTNSAILVRPNRELTQFGVECTHYEPEISFLDMVRDCFQFSGILLVFLRPKVDPKSTQSRPKVPLGARPDLGTSRALKYGK